MIPDHGSSHRPESSRRSQRDGSGASGEVPSQLSPGEASGPRDSAESCFFKLGSFVFL